MNHCLCNLVDDNGWTILLIAVIIAFFLCNCNNGNGCGCGSTYNNCGC